MNASHNSLRVLAVQASQYISPEALESAVSVLKRVEHLSFAVHDSNVPVAEQASWRDKAYSILGCKAFENVQELRLCLRSIDFVKLGQCGMAAELHTLSLVNHSQGNGASALLKSRTCA
jgi:hypothetical protein